MDKERKFLAYWDCEGFECILDITTAERNMLMQTLKGEKVTNDIPLNQMMLRARYNSQRSPEIWVFTSTVDHDSLCELSQNEPQMLADLIRERGTNVWRDSPSKQVIK